MLKIRRFVNSDMPGFYHHFFYIPGLIGKYDLFCAGIITFNTF